MKHIGNYEKNLIKYQNYQKSKKGLKKLDKYYLDKVKIENILKLNAEVAELEDALA